MDKTYWVTVTLNGDTYTVQESHNLDILSESSFGSRNSALGVAANCIEQSHMELEFGCTKGKFNLLGTVGEFNLAKDES